VEVWELVARESIRDLVARYNANGDTGRFDQVVELFAPDAVMDVDGTIYEGREQIRTIFTSAAGSLKEHAEERSGPLYLRHNTSTLQIDVESETFARSRCYYHVIMAHGLDHWGRYIDEFTCVDGRWYIAHRRVTTDGRTPGGWADARAPEASFRDH
jgi:ketosteroid isomerase-like protein